jgi:hypothetical protein
VGQKADMEVGERIRGKEVGEAEDVVVDSDVRNPGAISILKNKPHFLKWEWQRFITELGKLWRRKQFRDTATAVYWTIRQTPLTFFLLDP